MRRPGQRPSGWPGKSVGAAGIDGRRMCASSDILDAGCL